MVIHPVTEVLRVRLTMRIIRDPIYMHINIYLSSKEDLHRVAFLSFFPFVSFFSILKKNIFIVSCVSLSFPLRRSMKKTEVRFAHRCLSERKDVFPILTNDVIILSFDCNARSTMND